VSSSAPSTFPVARNVASRAACAAIVGVRSSSTTAGHTTTAAAGVSLLTRARELLGDYKQLSKLRLSLLVVSTAAGGYVLGSPETVDWAGLGWVSLGTLGAAASANTLNQVPYLSPAPHSHTGHL
jgi:heme O synthase-like polyprenyltransferase